MALNRDEILHSVDVPAICAIACADLGGELLIRTMSGHASVALGRVLNSGDAVLGAWLIRYSACDSSGKLLFADADIPKLAELPVKMLNDVGKAIMSHNGMSDDAIAELEKN